MGQQISRISAACLLTIALSLLLLAKGQASSIQMERVSIATDGTEANHYSSDPSISADGRYVAFASWASNLVPEDTNGQSDVFVHDRDSGTTEIVSIGIGGQSSNGLSAHAAISGDGRYIAFYSEASNLVPDDSNECGYPTSCPDIFLIDLQTGATELLSLDSNGQQSDGPSLRPAISYDGRFVAFSSSASNLVDDDTNSCPSQGYPGTCLDVFVRDRLLGTTERVSTTSDGEQANGPSHFPGISGDGQIVVFGTTAGNLIGENAPECEDASTGYCEQIIAANRSAGEIEVVSIGQAGEPGNNHSLAQAISANGRYVAFVSEATDLAFASTESSREVFVRDLVNGTTERVSLGESGEPLDDLACLPLFPTRCLLGISENGRYVAFEYRGTDGFTDQNTCQPGPNSLNCYHIYVRDLLDGVTSRISVDSGGVQGNGTSHSPSMSADGRVIAFESRASNFVPNDTNECELNSFPFGTISCADIFVRNLLPPRGDLNCDGMVYVDDLLLHLRAVGGISWAAHVDCDAPMDLNCDGVLDGRDSRLLLLATADLFDLSDASC